MYIGSWLLFCIASCIFIAISPLETRYQKGNGIHKQRDRATIIAITIFGRALTKWGQKNNSYESIKKNKIGKRYKVHKGKSNITIATLGKG